MAKKQTTIRLDETLFRELNEFCARARAKQEGVVEAAIFYVVHRLKGQDFLELMQATSDHISKPSSLSEGPDRDEIVKRTVAAARSVQKPKAKAE